MPAKDEIRNNEIRATARVQGLRTKRNNLLVAALCGCLLATVSLEYYPASIVGISAGLFAGFVYANFFEYCLHRFLLHSGRGMFAQQHMVHHNTLSSPEAARYVNFSSNPLGVVALFVANAIPFLILEAVFHNGWAAGAFASFAVYYILFEEIHWRSHMGGWLPKFLKSAARHHLLHHAHDSDRFNVFFPLFDRLMRTLHRPPSTLVPNSTGDRRAGG